MKNFIQTKWFTYCTYILIVCATLMIGFVLLQSNKTLNNVLTSFFKVAENRSFDYRQYIRTVHRQPVANDDIVLLVIDEASLEYLWDKYGEWPIPRSVYADVIDQIEQDNPQAIIFDFLFLKSIKSSEESDKKFVDTMNKYKNIYTGMNFDSVPQEVREPVNLPQRLKLNVKNNSQIDFSKKYSFSNCRPILSELLSGNVNVGLTTTIRSEDGIIRQIAPLMLYKNEYYPHLTFKAGSDYLMSKNPNNFIIDSKSNLITGSTKIPLTKTGDAILNWYGPSETHKTYPFYKVLNDIIKQEHSFNFKDKFVIIGATAVGLNDVKSVPIQSEVYPGVEVHATFLNNMLDNNFIKKSDLITNILILALVVIITGFIVMISSSTLFSVLSTILFVIAYVLCSYYVMDMFYIWIPVVLPVIGIVISFALSFLTKYLIKSRDFEYQYKLATVDGLTELYNHRYFQDTLRKQIEISKRYSQPFSIIIIDIDFFKKFNDTYGHQAGDAVLRQVAQTLKKNSRTTDYVCRYGGEEMSIILPNTSNEEALFHANRILKAVENKNFKLNATDTSHVTISLGVATYPEHADNPENLISYADKCLYYAKEHGRNQVGKISE